MVTKVNNRMIDGAAVNVLDYVAEGATDHTSAIIAALEATPLYGKMSFQGMGDIVMSSHVISYRGDIEIDFCGCDIYWRAPTGYVPDRTGSIVSNPRSPGIFCFRGAFNGEVDFTHTLVTDLEAGAEQFPVSGNSDLFTKGTWWTMNSNIVAPQTAGTEFSFLVQSQGDFGNPNEVRMHYKSGYRLAAGRTIRYRSITPVENVKLINMGKFYYEQEITDGQHNSQQASSLVSFELAVNCTVEDLDTYNHHYSVVFPIFTNNCRVVRVQGSPKSVASDQIVTWNSSLYTYSEDCADRSGRHVVDHTASAFCVVVNGRETGTRQGAYTTHGAYEHDLYFENTTGVFSMANSGVEYGESTRNVTVVNHKGSDLLAHKKVTGLVLQGCEFTGSCEINMDAFSISNSYLNNTSFVQVSNLGDTRCNIIGGTVNLKTGNEVQSVDVTNALYWTNVSCNDMTNCAFNGRGRITFTNCDIGSVAGIRNTFNCASLAFIGGRSAASWYTNSTEDQEVLVDGGWRYSGSGHSDDRVFNFSNTGGLKFFIGDSHWVGDNADVEFYIINRGSAYTTQYKCVGAVFQTGNFVMNANPWLGPDSFLYHKGNVEQGIVSRGMPDETPANIEHSDNMII